MTESSRFNFVALQLCFLFAVIYVGQVMFGFDPGFNASSSPFWKFFTSIFGHSDMEHLFNNLFFISIFGSILELRTSGKTLLTTFLVSALFANLAAFIFFPASSIIGASGGGMGILAALAVYRPRQIGLALGVPLPMWAALLAYIGINVAGLSTVTGTAHEAHLLGLVSGSIIGYHLRDRELIKLEEEDDNEEELEDENWREAIRKWEEKWMM